MKAKGFWPDCSEDKNLNSEKLLENKIERDGGNKKLEIEIDSLTILLSHKHEVIYSCNLANLSVL